MEIKLSQPWTVDNDSDLTPTDVRNSEIFCRCFAFPGKIHRWILNGMKTNEFCDKAQGL